MEACALILHFNLQLLVTVTIFFSLAWFWFKQQHCWHSTFDLQEKADQEHKSPELTHTLSVEVKR